MTNDNLVEKINAYTYGLNKEYISVETLVDKIVIGITNEMTKKSLYEYMSETAAGLATLHPDYMLLAGRLYMSYLHEETSDSFSQTVMQLYENINPTTKEKMSLVSDELYETTIKNRDFFNKLIDYQKDYTYDFFALKTLERSYLLKIDGKIVERPQDMLLRVAIGIHGDHLDEVEKTYTLMSEKWFTHASPTLFNAGTNRPQMSSCFLLSMKDDSIEGIYETLKESALISQSAGGLGIHIHNIRAKGTFIRGTNGTSNGIVPMLRVFNDTARYVDQGGGKRKGAFAIYIEPWHADIFDFLDLRKNHGKEELRARDLFYALWTNDLFMKRVENNENWSLFCPKQAPGLSDCYGEEFKKLYEQYELEGRQTKIVKAQELWFKILESQTETGTPYMLYKDSINEKSNQKNIGVIKSSNLCTEIMEYSDENETAVCNLASIVLNKFVKDHTFDFHKLFEVTKKVTYNLNKIIDRNYYPTPSTKRSNLRHRPIGIGVQGLADTFCLMKLNFDEPKALELNKKIFETIYFASLTSSMELAKTEGAYETFKGSPLSEGKFQFDLWEASPSKDLPWDWKKLRQDIQKFGVRNSLLVAPMPTASTSQILGNNECFEPFTSNIYLRRVLSGEFPIVNKHLVNDLMVLSLWNEEIKEKIIKNHGSIQNIDEIPSFLKNRYKTAWELKQKTLIDMAKIRAPFIDQSQSLNVFMEDINYGKLSSMHFYAWKSGLKTGMYYLRTKPATHAIQFTVKNDIKTSQEEMQCSLDNKDDCISCGS